MPIQSKTQQIDKKNILQFYWVRLFQCNIIQFQVYIKLVRPEIQVFVTVV